MVMYDNLYKSDPFVRIAFYGGTDFSVTPERRIGNTILNSFHLFQRVMGEY